MKNVQSLIYVVDSADVRRMEEAKKELMYLLREEEMMDIILLIFANKQDIYIALDVKEITERLGLSNIKRNWFIQPCCAANGDGLYEGLDWISSQLEKKKK